MGEYDDSNRLIQSFGFVLNEKPRVSTDLAEYSLYMVQKVTGMEADEFANGE